MVMIIDGTTRCSCPYKKPRPPPAPCSLLLAPCSLLLAPCSLPPAPCFSLPESSLRVKPTFVFLSPLVSRLTASPSRALSGELCIGGDKSVSHRALILSALCLGTTEISGLLESEDVFATLNILRALGVRIEKQATQKTATQKTVTKEKALWRVFGAGAGALLEPAEVLYCGNSGTSARLLCGLLAASPFPCILDGDRSLRARPMDRVLAPLASAGVRAHLRKGRTLPLTLTGLRRPLPLRHRLQGASAQVKSALLLFALCAQGQSEIIEACLSRDHTERLLLACGAKLEVEALEGGGRRLLLEGGVALRAPQKISVPGDASSAAFLILAATLCEGSDITIRGVGVNPTRTGFVETLREMGADITFVTKPPEIEKDNIEKNKSETKSEPKSEPMADLRVRSARLRGVSVPAARAAMMIDEYPALAMAAACAQGKTVMEGLAELRIKESDRLMAVSAGLALCGVRAEQEADSLTVYGMAKSPSATADNPVSIAAHGDHRIAMSFLTLGLARKNASISVDSVESIATSFPDFQQCMQSIGASLSLTPPAA